MEKVKEVVLEILEKIKNILKGAYDKAVFSICYIIVELIDRILVPFS